MSRGTLEVLLVSAKGLEDSDFLYPYGFEYNGKRDEDQMMIEILNHNLSAGMDPYAIITYRTQEKKSGLAAGEGSCPEWNESFLFSITNDQTELKIKLMDKDTFTADDFVGEATIPLEPVFDEENIPPMAYNIVKDEQYRGEIKVGLTFTRQRSREVDCDEEDLGGWKQSSLE